MPVCGGIREGMSREGGLPHQWCLSFPTRRWDRIWETAVPHHPLRIPKEAHQAGRGFCPEVNDEGSSKSSGPQFPLRGVPATDPNLRRRSPLAQVPEVGAPESHLGPALTTSERRGPRRPSRPAGLSTFLGAGGGGRRWDGTRARRGRERQGQVGPRVTPPCLRAPAGGQHPARGPQAHPSRQAPGDS